MELCFTLRKMLYCKQVSDKEICLYENYFCRTMHGPNSILIDANLMYDTQVSHTKIKEIYTVGYKEKNWPILFNCEFFNF